MTRPSSAPALGPPAGVPLRRIVLCALWLSLSSCGTGSVDDEDNGWRTEVASVLGAQVDAWNRGDIAGYMEGYWKSDSLVFTSGAKVRRGWNETFERYRASYDTREKMGTLSFSDMEYHPLGRDAAWVLGRWALERAGDRPGGVFTLILKKLPEGWRVVHDHTSSDRQ